MSDSNVIKARCPLCGHVFEVDLSTLTDEQIIYKGESTGDQYRLRCPVDHTYFVITIPPGGDGKSETGET